MPNGTPRNSADLEVEASKREALQRFQQIEGLARDVTDNSLSLERTQEALGTAIRKVTKIEDKEIGTIQRVVEERAARGEINNIACCKGCWYCCAQMVAATIPEVLRLANHIRESWTDDQRARLAERMAEYMTATGPYHEGTTKAKPRFICPLLQEAACSVWEVRPIVCRGVNSTDVALCKAKMDDPVGDPMIPQIAGQYYTSMYSRSGMRHALRKHGLDNRLHEMIPALVIAMANPDAAERYLAGEPVFAGTEIQGKDVGEG